MVGRSASMRAVFVMMLGACLPCGTLKSARVKNSCALVGRLNDLRLTQAQILWLLLVLHLLHWHPIWPCARTGLRLGRVAPLVVVPAHNLHEGGA